MNDAVNMGVRVKELRENRGLTLQQLSDITGISHPMLSQIENGKRTPSLENLITLANTLGTTPNYLLGWDFAWFESLHQEVKDFFLKSDYQPWLELALKLKDSGLPPEGIETAMTAFAKSVFELKKQNSSLNDKLGHKLL